MGLAWLLPLIALAGAMQAAGAAMNGALRQALNNAWLAASISFALPVPPMPALAAMFPRPLPTVAGVAAMPWWAPLGGIVGAVAVVLELMFVV